MSHAAASHTLHHEGVVSLDRPVEIQSIEPILLSHRYPAEGQVFWSYGRAVGVTSCLVKMTASDGTYGLGETYLGNFAPEVARSLVEFFAPTVVGADARSIRGLWESLYSKVLGWSKTGPAVPVMAAIECAAWDILGKVSGIPVCDLLDPGGKTEMRVYASGGVGVTDQALELELLDYIKRGFRMAKIRVGHDPAEAVRKVGYALSVVGNDLEIAVDAVQGGSGDPWSTETALAVGRELEGMGVAWFEEPCSTANLAGYRTLRESLNVPVTGGELAITASEVQEFVDAGAVDIVQPDVTWVGGISEFLKSSAYAQEHGVQVIPHVWGGGGTVMANYHAAFAAPNCTTVEFPTQNNPLVDELMVDPFSITGGNVRRPKVPGLGVHLPEGITERYPYQLDCHATLH